MTVAKYGTKPKLIRCYLGLNKKINVEKNGLWRNSYHNFSDISDFYCLWKFNFLFFMVLL